MGDFNEEVTSIAGLKPLNEKNRTYPSHNAEKVIDLIFTNVEFTKMANQILNYTPSDHLPVLVDLNFKN